MNHSDILRLYRSELDQAALAAARTLRNQFLNELQPFKLHRHTPRIEASTLYVGRKPYYAYRVRGEALEALNAIGVTVEALPSTILLYLQGNLA